MKLIVIHPDLEDEGGAYIRLTLQEYKDIRQHAHQRSMKIDEFLQSIIGKELAIVDAPSKKTIKSEAPTEKELEVLALVAEGLSNLRIAAALSISEGSVKEHVHNLLGKFGVNKRIHLAVYYLAHYKNGAATEAKAGSTRKTSARI